MKTYKLGTANDRILTVKKCDGDYVVTLKIENDDAKYVELPSKRWALFRTGVDDINIIVKAMMEGQNDINFRVHIGGGYYVSVTSGISCVDFRKFYKPNDAREGDVKPTKRGVALRLEEWSHLCSLIDVINAAYPTLASALPCYRDGEHLDLWITSVACTECYPFGHGLHLIFEAH